MCAHGHSFIYSAYSLSTPLQDMDDMDADLFASKKKPSSAPAQTKAFGNEGPKKDFTTLENDAKLEGAGNSMQDVLAYITFSLLASRYYRLWSLHY